MTEYLVLAVIPAQPDPLAGAMHGERFELVGTTTAHGGHHAVRTICNTLDPKTLAKEHVAVPVGNFARYPTGFNKPPPVLLVGDAKPGVSVPVEQPTEPEPTEPVAA